MKLSKLEFDTLIKIPWTERLDNDGKLFYTPTNATYTQLFNMDLLRKILVKKFQQQNAITRLPHYDITMPVVLYPDLRLKLSSELEAIDYFYNMKFEKPPTFIVNISSAHAILVCIVLFFIVIVISFICSRSSLRNRTFSRILNSRIL